MGSIKCSRETSFSFFIIFFAAFSISFGTRYWIAVIGDISKTTSGLWQACLGTEDNQECGIIGIDLKENSKLFTTTQITMCIALICYVASLISYSIWLNKSQQWLEEHGAGPSGITALSLSLIGGAFNLCAVATYVKLYEDFAERLHYSYYLAVSSCVVMSLNSIITLSKTTCCFKGQNQASPPEMSTITPGPAKSEDYPHHQNGYPSNPKNPPQLPPASAYSSPSGIMNNGYAHEREYPGVTSYPSVPSPLESRPPHNPYKAIGHIPRPHLIKPGGYREPEPDYEDIHMDRSYMHM